MFWDNAYPLEVQFNPAPSLSFRAMGGSGVFHILSGPTPADVIKQMTEEIIGLPQMPPFWSLGLHLCRENDNATVFQKTLKDMINSTIPFDSDCIDARLSGPGFGSIDTNTFPTAQDDRKSLQDHGIKFLLSQPPHAVDQNINSNLQWVQSDANGQSTAGGKRFNTTVYYPSFPAIDSDENDPLMHLDMNDLMNPDGISFVDTWPSNEDSSSCLATDNNTTRPFIPERLRLGNAITAGTLCMDSFHPNLGLDHVAVHNHYAIQLLDSLPIQKNEQQERRMLYLNRASAMGNLGLAGYSGDDFSANWLSMKMALVQVSSRGPFKLQHFRSGMKPIINSFFLCIRVHFGV